MHILHHLLVATLATTSLAAHAGPQPPVDAGLLQFSEEVRSCTAATATQPHPLMKGFTIEHAVVGLGNGGCDYTQSMPGGMRMQCKFDDTARDAFANELEQTATTGRMSGSSSGPQPAWASACEIETKDGKRIPFGGG